MVYFLFGSVYMEWYYIVIIYLCAFIFFVLIHKIGKNKKPLKRAFLSFFPGLLGLTAINLSSVFTGVYLPVSLLSVTVSSIGGIPGLTALLTMNLFF
ncbi:MAG: pro-sigmaK processing inhibitor BofA family protein [Ruminococcus sp.]